MKFRKKEKITKNNYHLSSNEKIQNSLSILELEPNVNKEELKKKYNSLVKKYHPDVKNNINNKEKKMKEINKAYKILQKLSSNRCY